MRAAVYVGIFVFVIICKPVYNLFRTLSCRAVIKPNKRVTVYFFVQNREIGAYLLQSFCADNDTVISFLTADRMNFRAAVL